MPAQGPAFACVRGGLTTAARASNGADGTTITSSMPNFTLSEILTIAVVILIVFGPQRLPEMAQKAGALIRRGRTVINDLRTEFDLEIREVTEPLKEVQQELKGVREDMSSSVSSLTDEVNQAKREIEGQLDKTKREADEVVTGRKDAVEDSPKLKPNPGGEDEAGPEVGDHA